MSTKSAGGGDPTNPGNDAWEPNETEDTILASFWQGYDNHDTLVIYDSEDGEAWIEIDTLFVATRQEWR